MTSKLAQMQARFQQKQIQEREEKLLKLYENQQQRAIERVSRGSAGSNTTITTTAGGKVRQMFDERRSMAGIDKSYPLKPLKAKSNPKVPGVDRKATTTTRTTVRSTVANSVSSFKNGKPVINKREVVHSIYSNNNGDETYEEHRIEDDNSNNYSSKSHRDMIDILNNHNSNNDLDNEELPKIGFDEVDEAAVPLIESKNINLGKITNVSGMKAIEPKTPKTSRTATKENNTVVRKTSRPSPTTPSKSLSSSRTATPPTPAKTPSSAGSSTTTMSSKNKITSGQQRAPTSSRPSDKQLSSKTKTAAVTRDDLAECNFCGRRFAADRIQKHEDICSKTGKKKRKAYDATKHRVMGTELETYILKPTKGKVTAVSSSRSSKPAQKKDWRRTHEEFIAAIRSAKEAQAHLARGGKLTDLPPPPPSSNPDYVQCPHCGRKFNESAAERHIPKCASYQFNKPKGGGPPPKGKPQVPRR